MYVCVRAYDKLLVCNQIHAFGPIRYYVGSGITIYIFF